jgi:hypothetical protein
VNIRKFRLTLPSFSDISSLLSATMPTSALTLASGLRRIQTSYGLRTSRRTIHNLLLVLAISANLGTGPAARAQTAGDTGDGSVLSAALVTNASPVQLRAVEGGLDELNRLVQTRDVALLRQLEVSVPTGNVLAVRARPLAVAVTVNGALVRVRLSLWAAPDAAAAPKLLKDALLDVWMKRVSGVQDGVLSGLGEQYVLTEQRWSPPGDAVESLSSVAAEQWEVSFAPGLKLANSAIKDSHPGELLHLVVQRRGGRWIALRHSQWDGTIVSPPLLAQMERENVSFTGGAMQRAQGDVRPWLRRQLARFEKEGPGTAHIVLQKGQSNWVGLNTVWDVDKAVTPEVDRVGTRWREAMSSVSLPPNWLAAIGHRDYAVALAQLGLFNEAADEAEKAELLQPGIIGARTLAQYDKNRIGDPQALAILQIQNESRLGVGWDHPIYMLNNLTKREGAQPTALGALQIGLEYSKLAQDAVAAGWLKYAHAVIARGGLKKMPQNDVQWASILYEQLEERGRFALNKPSKVIRSGLFTIRCWPNDLSTVQLLAGLEAAQHTVYEDFNVALGNTEVVLWRNQSEFQSYTREASGTVTSEFIAALTLTRLVASQSGPVVLGEEINFFADPRANTISTIAHEYGHVAVRHVSNGRTVPMWLNEGIATSVEGGYDGYLTRVRTAATRGTLLTMRELAEWDVDGERAFLAYSQANSMVDFITARWDKPGQSAILEILRQIGRDVPPETAIRNVLKVSTHELWNMWAREGIR